MITQSSKLFQKFLLKGVIIVGNLLGIIIGVVAIVLGLILLFTWWAMFIKALMALVPILLIVIGAGILIYFISEIKSKLEMKKEETAPSGEKKPE